MNLSDIVLSCRVRLARNVSDMPFPKRLDEKSTQALTDSIAEAAKGMDGMRLVSLAPLSLQERQMLVEKHLASRELIANDSASLLINGDSTISVMICEEDHLRIQCILPSLDLERADRMSAEVDKAFSDTLSYAFDAKLGYLTACPTNLGTGMRASAMLHLVGLSIARQTDGLFRQITKLGVAVRGFYGEGSAALGHIYQISNQHTLGVSENEIITTLSEIVRQIYEQEVRVRLALYEKNPVEARDLIGLPLGICRYAERLSYPEFMHHISNIKLGISLGVIRDIIMEKADELLVNCQGASLCSRADEQLDAESENIARAAFLRKEL